MKTKTKTVKKTLYICENCGATHSNPDKIITDYLTGEEICTKCQDLIKLVDRTIYYYGANDYDYKDVWGKVFPISKDSIKITECDREFEMDDYYNEASRVKELYIKLMDRLDSAYIQGKVRDFNIKEELKNIKCIDKYSI